MAIRRKARTTRRRRGSPAAPTMRQTAFKANLERFREMTARISKPEAPSPPPPPGQPQARAAIVGAVLPALAFNEAASMLRRLRRANSPALEYEESGYQKTAGAQPWVQEAHRHLSQSMHDARGMMTGAEQVLVRMREGCDTAGTENAGASVAGSAEGWGQSVSEAHEAATEAQRLRS